MRRKRRWGRAGHAACRAYSEMRGWRGPWTLVCGDCKCGCSFLEFSISRHHLVHQSQFLFGCHILSG